MALCETALPPVYEKELRRLVKLVPADDLAAFAATDQIFKAGGFRSGNTAVLRTRIQQIVCGAADVSDTLRRLLARRSRAHTLTGLMSPDAIADNRHALSALLGGEVLMIALLLDHRREVRDKAENWLKTPAPFMDMTPAEAHDRLKNSFADFIELAGMVPESGGLPITREAWQHQKEKLEGRVRDLSAENRRLKGVDDRLSRVVKELKESSENLKSCNSKAAVLEKELSQAKTKAAETTAELQREKSARDERLKAALDVALAQEFHGWLAQARTVEAAAFDDKTHGDLLDRAEAALKKQAAADRHSGNLAKLIERVETLESARKRVLAALRNALRPTPELKALESEIGRELERLNTLITPDAAATPLEQSLVTRINSADDNELPNLREVPELLRALAMIDEAAFVRLKQAFKKRLATVEALGVPPDKGSEARDGKSSLLGRALAGSAPAILMIDGHNMLFGLPARYSPARGKALNDAAKRERLVADIVRVTAPNPAVRAWIVFDGPTRSDTQAAPNVRVTYSGGKGEHRADGVIIDNLKFFKSSDPGMRVFLVSNDKELCEASQRLGACNVEVLDFGAFL
ncbi:MAG: hypothetical protein PHU80_06900 [Kiritimatiellae bacterium]|nr:hypothetical protein [Kiritimatiellia bacterium]